LIQFLDSIEYATSSVIGIDEAQFFPDLYEFVVASEKENKKIIIAGLDGDFNRKPFGKILECIPLCDEIVKLTALDKDGTPAIFTKRINDANQEQVCVGAANLYQAVSRKHYLE
jgi:thymidine kinase